MKQLKLAEYLETNILYPNYQKAPRMRFSKLNRVYDKHVPFAQMMDVQTNVRFELKTWANVAINDYSKDNEHHAKQQCFQMLCRSMFGDLHDEIADIRDWAFQEGIGKDLDDKLSRLMKLARGETIIEDDE